VHLLVVNCNTSHEISETIDKNAKSVASPGTTITTVTPTWGPASAEGFLESFVTAAAVLDTVACYQGDVDAIVMAGFGEHGREGMRQLVDVPVVDVTESSAYLAALVSFRFAIITTLKATIPGIEMSLHQAGILDRCSEIVAIELPVLQINEDVEATVNALAEAASAPLRRGADAIVLGCAGFAGLDQWLQERLGVPVIDGVTSAVALAEVLVRLGKRTSKRGPFAPSLAKRWTGWPVSAAPRQRRLPISGAIA
jgi:allantoin racemase